MNSLQSCKGCLFLLLSILLLATFSTVGHSAVVVEFPDPGLEEAIREAIDKPTGDIYDSDLVGLTELEAQGQGISNLSGLEYCTGLTELWLDGNQISDLSPLAGLTGLPYLSLGRNPQGRWQYPRIASYDYRYNLRGTAGDYKLAVVERLDPNQTWVETTVTLKNK